MAAAPWFVYPASMSEANGEWSRDYRRIERAIFFIEENRERRPELAEVAAVAGVSEFYFQRLFSRMVGISPKKYEQFLAKEAAKRLLADSESLLDTALDVGLSGPGRLHDLFVSCEAVTPGEFKNGGAGLTITYGFHPSPFGEALLATTSRGICALAFAAEGGREPVLARLRGDWPNARLVEDQAGTLPVATAIFASAPRAAAPLTLYLRGTNFQVKVWEALLAIPPGPPLHLRGDRAAHRGAGRDPRGRNRGRAQSHRVHHPLPPGDSKVGRAGRLSLGRRTQAPDARVGVRAVAGRSRLTRRTPGPGRGASRFRQTAAQAGQSARQHRAWAIAMS